ncbi:MAG: hypothetical protein WCJ21_01560, partial [Planctomycetota bacterium]
APPVSTKLMKCMESAYSAKTTTDRLITAFQTQGMKVAERIPPTTTATKTESELPLAEHLLFERTDARSDVVLRTPTRILVWQEPSGEVWLGTPHAAEPAAFSGGNERNEAIPQVDQTEAAMAFAAGACQ